MNLIRHGCRTFKMPVIAQCVAGIFYFTFQLCLSLLALFLEKSAKKSSSKIPFKNNYIAVREEFETPPTMSGSNSEFLNPSP